MQRCPEILLLRCERIKPPQHLIPSFRTEQADFFFRIRSCECVGLRREKSLFAFVGLT
jgi:hypothetical protein